MTDPIDPEWELVAARAADAKGGDAVIVLDVGPVLGVCGHFVITSASSDRLVKSIAEEVEHQVAQAGGPRPKRIEGMDDRRWVLMDYGDFVVHVFLDEARRFYDLERLWSDVARVPWQADSPTAAEA